MDVRLDNMMDDTAAISDLRSGQGIVLIVGWKWEGRDVERETRQEISVSGDEDNRSYTVDGLVFSSAATALGVATRFVKLQALTEAQAGQIIDLNLRLEEIEDSTD